MENNQEQPTVEVFTEEQLQLLPKGAQESIIFLEKNLPSKELLVLNPLVSHLLRIKEHENLKYVEGDKSVIDSYKVAKKDISSFKKASGEAKKAMKGPIDAIGKQILAIEKEVNSVADQVLNTMMKEFDAFEKEEEKRIEADRAKRVKKETETINQLTQEQQDQANQIEKTKILNKIKFEAAADIEMKVNQAIDNYSMDALKNLYTEVSTYNETSVFTGFRAEAKNLIEKLLLTDDEFINACNFYQEKIRVLLNRIQDKIQLLETTGENQKLQTEKSTISSLGTFMLGAAGKYDSNIEPAVPENVDLPITTQPIKTQAPLVFRNEDGTVNFSGHLANICEGLILQKQDLIELYDVIRLEVKTEDDAAKVKKLSGICVLLGKVIDYIN